MQIPLLSGEKKAEQLRMLRSAPLDISAFPCRYSAVSYGADPNQTLHIFLPSAGTGPFPVIVYLHGGGWEGGSPEDTQAVPFLRGLDRGYAVISCGYRLLPKVHFPDNLYDVKNALREIVRIEEAYCLDTNRLFLAGSSAGAHLALMAAFTEDNPAYDCSSEPLPKIRGAVDLFGPTDFTMEDEHYRMTGYPRLFPPAPPAMSAPSRLLGMDASLNPGLLRLLSPLYLVHPRIPPILILHGRTDPMVSWLQSKALYDRILQVCGDDRAGLVISEETTHADCRYEEEPYTSRIFDFLDDIRNKI